ncbi:hypothetical protein A9Q98_15025 [Thalassotalea sp. 42_200_T64]|nr:hypothetical protein A9Q98_15025 [Thalassotalea sp. 42_200_T64]
MSKSVLFVAIDYPPCRSPGTERIYKFSKNLQEFGWLSNVLTVNVATHNLDLLKDDHQDEFNVHRSFCLDTVKYLSYKGKYFSFCAIPDRYISWVFTALFKGLWLIKKFKPIIIFSSSPSLTSHIVAGLIAKITKTPWVVDFRDPLQCHYDDKHYQSFKVHRWIEKKVIAHCSQAIFTTRSAQQMYQRLYPGELSTKFITIANGVDLNNFDFSLNKETNRKNFLMLHTGSIYPTGRDPRVLFSALAQLKKKNLINKSNFLLRFRGAKCGNVYQQMIIENNIADIIEFKPSIAHKDCLIEMKAADGLLIIQGKIFFSQIPSKIYEYFITNKKIIAVTPNDSETARALTQEPGCYVAESRDDICQQVLSLINNREKICREVDKFERKHRAGELSVVFNSIHRL